MERKVHTAEHLASAMFCSARRWSRSRGRSCSGAHVDAQSLTAVFHAVAAAPDKTWPAENFLEVAAHLRIRRVRSGVCGRGDRRSDRSSSRTLQASLADLKALLARASLFIGNDSGPGAHGGGFRTACGGVLRAVGPRGVGAVADGVAGARNDGVGGRRDRGAGAAAGGGMKELARLIGHARRFSAQLVRPCC